jgi:type I restriction enzyme S subunit
MNVSVNIEPLSSDRTMFLPSLPKGWEWQRFADHCDRVSVGHVGPTSEFFCPRSEGVTLIRSQDVRPGRLMHETAAAVTPEFHAKLKKSKLQAGDILFVRVGANRGDCCVVPDGIGELNCANIVFARPKVKNGFFGFYFRSPIGQSHLLAATTGAAQGVINTGSVAEMPVPVPPLPVQRRIAGILSAYDELIENSQRRIRLLEDMARALYREWFVHFRFPGYESVPRLPSALGDIPQGWEVTTIDDVCDRVTDGSHSSPKSVESGMPMASSKDMHHWGLTLSTCRHISVEDYHDLVRNDCKPKKDDVLITKDGANYLKHIFVQREEQDMVLLSSVAMLRPNKRINPHLLAAILKDPDNKDRLKNYVTGAAIPRVILKDFKRFQFVLPSATAQAAWAKHAEPITDMIWRLIDQIQNLRRTRDLLLPRLLSGQVELSTVEVSA